MNKVPSYFPFLADFVATHDLEINTYLEIGVCEGNCVRNIVSQIPDIEKLVLCDTWGNTYGGSDRGNHDHIEAILVEEGFPLERAIFLDGDSKVKIPEYFADNPEIFDVIFIDGDHSFMGCWQDMVNCIDYCEICIVHDIRHPAHFELKDCVYSFYNLIKDRFYMVDDGSYLVYFIKKDIFV